MAMLMAKDTSGASAILKYSQIVYEIYQNFGLSAVLYHDENFWKTRQSPVIDWDHMDSELWLKASTIPSMPVQPYIPFELPPPPPSTHPHVRICQGLDLQLYDLLCGAKSHVPLPITTRRRTKKTATKK